MKHCLDWASEPSKSEGEQHAKEFVSMFVATAFEKYRDGTNDRLDKTLITCTYKGDKCKLVGASRLGDIWLRKLDEPEPYVFYNHRIDAEEITDWNLEKHYSE